MSRLVKLAVVLAQMAVGSQALAQSFTIIKYPGAFSTSSTAVSGGTVTGSYILTSGYSHGFMYNASGYTNIDPPVNFGMTPTAIDGSTIAGYYQNGTGTHGFLYGGSGLTTFDPPGSRGTFARAVSGDNVVGNFTGDAHDSFIYNTPSATYTYLAPPNSQLGATVPTAIDGGRVVGQYLPNGAFSYAQGFVYDGNGYTVIAPAGGTGVHPAAVQGSHVVGYYTNAVGGAHGFLFDGSNFTNLDVPGSTNTRATGVWGNLIVGYYTDNSFSAHGFVYDGSTFSAFDVPGQRMTQALAISGSTITGTFIDQNNRTQGFVYTLTPVPEPSGIIALGLAGLAGGLVCSRRRRRIGTA